MASAGDLPLVSAPPGYVVDLRHPPRNGETAGFWVPGVGMVLSTSFLAARLYTKVYLSRTAGLDDGNYASSSVLACISKANI
jgi:hypothetical protein